MSWRSDPSRQSPRSVGGDPSIPSGSPPGRSRRRPDRNPGVDVFHGPEAFHFEEVDPRFRQGAGNSRRVTAGEEADPDQSRSTPLQRLMGDRLEDRQRAFDIADLKLVRRGEEALLQFACATQRDDPTAVNERIAIDDGLALEEIVARE